MQLLGKKHFVLLPPSCHPCVNESYLMSACYERSDDRGSGLELRLEGGNDVPFAIWDPDEPGVNATRYSHLARPIRVTLNPGDMLYLPAMWYVCDYCAAFSTDSGARYHKVSQSCSPDQGICVAVNYW